MKDRCLVTLFDKNEQIIERKITDKSMVKIADILGIQKNLDAGDVIIIESEEL